MKLRPERIAGLRVTVMGLGLHGGGLASALFFARRGARVTVTDTRADVSSLEPALRQLRPYGVREVLGRHEARDFAEADLVIKNPAVRPGSPYLQTARDHGVAVETDLSIFLTLCPATLVAVSGTKGKSTTASAIHHCLRSVHPGARLGGNITVSPLEFLPELEPGDPVVLELSSWQLADLRGRDLLRPRVSVTTVILPDHQDRYPGMEAYVADKQVLFGEQRSTDWAVLNLDDPYQQDFPARTAAQVRWFSASPLPEGRAGAFLGGELRGFLQPGGQEILPRDLLLPGRHNRVNLLAAALACRLFGLQAGQVRSALASFPGIEHRLELVAQRGGVRFYNDSAATIPQATAAALESLEGPLVLLTGGTDKKLDFEPLRAWLRRPGTIVLLKGSATEKLEALLREEGLAYQGPFATLEEAVARAAAAVPEGGALLFSPGSASFELFQNEFDRGRRFRELVLAQRP